MDFRRLGCTQHLRNRLSLRVTVISCLALRHRAEFCAVKCELNHNLMGWAGEAYAEVLAGIGCKCVCCLRLLDGYWFGWHDDLDYEGQVVRCWMH
eukprot:3463379-Prymnesium_polylepis.1